MRHDQISPVPQLTPITKGIILTCVVTYFLEVVLTQVFKVAPGGYPINEIFGLVPRFVVTQFWLWQFVTYIFLHGHPLHILLNMLILWYFGSEIEQRMGKKEFFFYFFLCGIGAGLFNFAVNAVLSGGDVSLQTSPMIGASGAIFGILAAYGVFFGDRYFLVFFLFPMKAKYFVLVMAGIELLMGLENKGSDNVAHFAHIGGMIVGAIYMYFRYVRPSLSRITNRKDADRERLKRQFTLIVNEKEKTKDDKDEKGPYWN